MIVDLSLGAKEEVTVPQKENVSQEPKEETKAAVKCTVQTTVKEKEPQKTKASLPNPDKPMQEMSIEELQCIISPDNMKPADAKTTNVKSSKKKTKQSDKGKK